MEMKTSEYTIKQTKQNKTNKQTNKTNKNKTSAYLFPPKMNRKG